MKNPPEVPHQFIVVEGPIGVGKTSLVRRLCSSLSAEEVLEQAAVLAADHHTRRRREDALQQGRAGPAVGDHEEVLQVRAVPAVGQVARGPQPVQLGRELVCPPTQLLLGLGALGDAGPGDVPLGAGLGQPALDFASPVA